MSDLEEIFDKATFNQTGLRIALDLYRLVKGNTTKAVSALETVFLYLTKGEPDQDSLKTLLDVNFS